MIISSLPGLLEAASTPPPPDEYMVKPNCTEFKCGNFSIPYPFGIGEDCYSSPWFSINCNHSFNPPKLFLNHSRLNLEVLNISVLDRPTVTVNSPISSSCNNSSSTKNETNTRMRNIELNLNGSPFWFSKSDTIFMVLGCGSARLMNQTKGVMAGCASICRGGRWNETEDCFGVNCCHTTISSTGSSIFKNYSVNFTTEEEEDNVTDCVAHALLVDTAWFSSKFSSQALIETGYAPLSLLWGIQEPDSYADHRCVGEPLSFCSCGFGTEGNPFLKNGCRGTPPHLL